MREDWGMVSIPYRRHEDDVGDARLKLIFLCMLKLHFDQFDDWVDNALEAMH